MTTKNFFIFQAILNLSFGIGLLLMPQMTINMYAVDEGDLSSLLDMVARSYGTGLIGFGLAAYFIRDAQPSLARYAFLLATCITGVLITVVHIMAIVQGVENNLAWGRCFY